jgi:hypothetical protein
MKFSLVGSVSAVLLLGLYFVGSGWTSQPPSQQPSDPASNPKVLAFLKPVDIADSDNELQKKLKERHNSGVALLDERVKEHRKGARDLTSIYQAARLVAEAKLDLTTNAPERITLLEQLLEIHKLMESHLQEQLAKGFGSKADLELARYTRLSTEVDLLRAKQKTNP